MLSVPRLCLSAGAVLSLIAGAAAPAEAGQPRTHDGFFLRLSAGGGYAQTEIDDAFNRLELSGGAGDVNLAIGAAVSRNFILHGTLAGWTIEGPDVEFNNAAGEADDASVNLGGIGPGITWYAMPANLYLSASLLLSSMTVEVPGDDYESDAGVSVDLTIGKEWWVGGGWGLGVAGGMNLHSIPDEESDESFTGISFALRFSATLN